MVISHRLPGLLLATVVAAAVLPMSPARADTSATFVCDAGNHTYTSTAGSTLVIGGNADGACTMSGTVPASAVVELNGVAVTANSGTGNAGTIAFIESNGNSLNGGIATPAGGTFTNSGTIIDHEADHAQVLYAGSFLNSGRIEAAGGNGLRFDGSGIGAGLLDNTGALVVDAGSMFEVDNPASVRLDPGSSVTVAGSGILRVSQTGLEVAGGTVTGTITGFAANLLFDPSATSSTGAVAEASNGTLTGVIPAGWTVSQTGGTLDAAAGAGNAGTLLFPANYDSLIATGGFTNSGTFAVTTGAYVTAAPFTNTGLVSVPAAARLEVTGGLSLTPNSTLQVGVAGAGSYGGVSVSTTASLGGTLAVVRSASYAPAVGDTQRVISAGGVTGSFAAATGGNGSGFYSLAYTPTTVSLVTTAPPAPAAPAPTGPVITARTGLLHLVRPATLLSETLTGKARTNVAGHAGVPGKGAAAAVVLVTASAAATLDGHPVTGSALLTLPNTALTVVAARRSAVKVIVLGYYLTAKGTGGESWHATRAVTLKTPRNVGAYRAASGAAGLLVKVSSAKGSSRIGGLTLPASRSAQYVLIDGGRLSAALAKGATVTVLGYLAPLSVSTGGSDRQPSSRTVGPLVNELH